MLCVLLLHVCFLLLLCKSPGTFQFIGGSTLFKTVVFSPGQVNQDMILTTSFTLHSSCDMSYCFCYMSPYKHIIVAGTHKADWVHFYRSLVVMTIQFFFFLFLTSTFYLKTISSCSGFLKGLHSIAANIVVIESNIHDMICFTYSSDSEAQCSKSSQSFHPGILCHID
jgi:hypothetical protein